jgi:hypothetical protein
MGGSKTFTNTEFESEFPLNVCGHPKENHRSICYTGRKTTENPDQLSIEMNPQRPKKRRELAASRVNSYVLR